MKFSYQIIRRNGGVEADFRTYNAIPNWTVPNHADLIQIAKAVEFELRNGILDTIFQSKGDYHLTVDANVTGMTSVRLNLVGQGYAKNDVNFEMPSCLGGIVSPLLGNEIVNEQNSSSVEILLSRATGYGDVDKALSHDPASKEFYDYAQSNLWSTDHIDGNLGELDKYVDID